MPMRWCASILPCSARAVQEHSGAIVKTIGDAVMAVFSRPTDAVSAALHILR